MKTYFYSVNGSRCADTCYYPNCPKRYLLGLQRCMERDVVCALEDSDPRMTLSPEVYPKIGDIIVLFAKDQKDLDRLIIEKDRFEGLKRILVVAETRGIADSRYHELAPRYITQAKRSCHEVESVIQKMKQQLN